MYHITKLFTILGSILCICYNTITFAASGVPAGVECTDGGKTCIDTGEKIIEGVKVSKPCWKYAYSKTCQFPSKNDCHLISHCYEVGLKECLLKDSLGNCVNQIKEFSCERKEPAYINRDRLKQNLKGDEASRVICKGIPCIDGNCVDKSYDMDGDMIKSVSQLYAASKTAGAKDLNFKLFEGFSQRCSKKPTDYLNCCKIKGWGTNLGAKCNQDERKLQDLRAKKLCVYVGKSTSGKRPFHTNKHHFCCFGNMLNKVFQVEGRKQLGKNFGSGGNTDCGGLTLAEIIKLDFEKMDFSEFVSEIKSKMKLPNVGDIESRVTDSIPNIKTYDSTISNPELHPVNKSAGVNDKIGNQLSDEGDYGK